jgi:hypothetical protein
MNFLFVILVLANFLRTIGILVVVYYGLKFVIRLLFPVVVKKAMNNMQARQSAYTREQKHEGEVTVESKRRDQNRNKTTEGEYVDFEEVD